MTELSINADISGIVTIRKGSTTIRIDVSVPTYDGYLLDDTLYASLTAIERKRVLSAINAINEVLDYER